MLFRSAVALLLVFSLVVIDAAPAPPPGSPPTQETGPKPATEGETGTPGTPASATGEKFSQVIACALEKLSSATKTAGASPAQPPAQQAATAGDEPPAPILVFDQCAKQIYGSAQASGATTS